jgi:hypothetical protein
MKRRRTIATTVGGGAVLTAWVLAGSFLVPEAPAADAARTVVGPAPAAAPAGPAASVAGGPATSPADRLQPETFRGKYQELVGQDLYLMDNPTPFVIEDPATLGKVLEFRSQKDNLEIVGRSVDRGGTRAVEVESISLGPSDLDLYTKELEVLSERGREGRSAALLDLLGRVARARDKLRDAELGPLALRIGTEALRAEDEALELQDIEGRLLRVREVYRHTEDVRLVFEYLVELDRRFPDQAGVRAFLLALHCRKYAGKWVTYDEFKAQEGFVLCEGRWLLPRDRDLLETIKAAMSTSQTNMILRRRTEREYKLLAEKGVVEEGMKPEEVYNALGFPDRVERRLVLKKEFDQWTYGGKYCYFWGGLLVRKP